MYAQDYSLFVASSLLYGSSKSTAIIQIFNRHTKFYCSSRRRLEVEHLIYDQKELFADYAVGKWYINASIDFHPLKTLNFKLTELS